MTDRELDQAVDKLFDEYEDIVRDLKEFDGDKRGMASALLRQRDLIADAILVRGPGFPRWEDQ